MCIYIFFFYKNSRVISVSHYWHYWPLYHSRMVCCVVHLQILQVVIWALAVFLWSLCRLPILTFDLWHRQGIFFFLAWYYSSFPSFADLIKCSLSPTHRQKILQWKGKELCWPGDRSLRLKQTESAPSYWLFVWFPPTVLSETTVGLQIVLNHVHPTVFLH